jgi:[acyl-carrier-protein] S-malonyltransferase
LTIAFVFPGQGSQSIGMQAGLAAVYSQVLQTYEEASDVLGFDLWRLVQEGPKDRLNETINTQPVMLTADVATWRAYIAAGGIEPSMMAGHSLGEYSALVCAASLAFPDALKLVRRRAELMQNAVPAGEGAMAAILGLDDQAIANVCTRAASVGVAEPVNFNSPGQVVVAGHRAAIERLVNLAKEAGARRAIMLPVSVPSHSSLMRPAGEALAAALNDTHFRASSVPVISAVDATPYGSGIDIQQRLMEQVFSPVRWVDVINRCTGLGATSIIECGPGKVLTGLTKRINRDVIAACIDSVDALSNLAPADVQTGANR